MTAEQNGPPPGSGSSDPEVGSLAYEFDAAVRHHMAGRLDQAERRYRRVLRRHPEHPDALNMLGIAAGQRGKPDAAIDFLRRAIRVSDQNPDYHYNLGMALQAGGDTDSAIASYRRAVELKGDYADALKNLGGAYLLKDQLEDAESFCREALRLAPNDAEAHNNLATVLLGLADFDGAAASAREALRLVPNYAAAHNNLGAAYLGREDYGEAEKFFAEALRLNPRYAEAHNNRGMALLGIGDVEAAIASLREAFAARPNYVDAHRNLGNAFRELGYFSEALAELREADRLRPNDPGLIMDLGAALQDQVEVDAALAQYDKVLERNPNESRALAGKANLLLLKGATDACYEIVAPALDTADPSPWMASLFANFARDAGQRDDAVALLEAMLTRENRNKRERVSLHFALGKLYDADDAFDEAFRHFSEGNALRSTKFHPAKFAANVDRIIAFYSAENLARLPRATIETELPVFIVGMPRSGTTLVEQILDSHPAVFGAGELDHIARFTHTIAGGLGNADAYPECVAEVDSDTLDGFVEEHLADLGRRGGHAVRVTDKMPHNFLHLGLIAQLYPNARIIHCVRDPLDTCLSCFFQNFRRGHFYSYNFEHLGQYYAQYQRLMQHWRNVLDIPILELSYEDLVADVEVYSRRLVDFVGLEWDERCLRFYESRRLVATASYDQVRQPIYTRSVGRWRHYEQHLGPLKAALQATA